MFDMNAGCGHWPFWPTPAEDAASLESLLRDNGIHRACAYPLEAYLYPDPQDANERRLPELAASDFFVPSAVLNPTMPNARRAFDACKKRWNVPLVRLFPGYHTYNLDHPGVNTLAEAAMRSEVALGVHVRAVDERSQHPIAQVAPVPFADIVDLAERHPTLQVVAFCALPHEVSGALSPPGSAPGKSAPSNLFVEMSFFESEDPLQQAMAFIPIERLLFGSHAPLFYPLANILKIRYSESDEAHKERALRENATTITRSGHRQGDGKED